MIKLENCGAYGLLRLKLSVNYQISLEHSVKIRRRSRLYMDLLKVAMMLRMKLLIKILKYRSKKPFMLKWSNILTR